MSHVTQKRRLRKFFDDHNLIRRVDRKYWNKAVDLIEGGPPKECSRFCQETRKDVFSNNSRTIHVHTMLTAIRHAILRHDWHCVHQLLEAFLTSSGILMVIYRGAIHKIMTLLLLSSPKSNYELIEDFCRMVVGINDSEIDIFLKTIRQLPKEIPRGRRWFRPGGTLKVHGENGKVQANSYVQASQDIRLD